MTFDLPKLKISRADADLLLDIQEFTHSSITLKDVLTRRPEFTLREARSFLERCSEANLVGWNDLEEAFVFTDETLSFSTSDVSSRVSLNTAQEALNRVVDKARSWNANASKVVVIEELRLFGALLLEQDDYDSVDIEAVVCLRPGSEAQLEELSEALPKSQSRSFGSPSGRSRIAFERAIRKAMKHLGRGSSVVSIYGPGTIERLGADWRQVYAYDTTSGTEVAADPAMRKCIDQRRDGASVEAVRLPELVLPAVEPQFDDTRMVSSETIAKLSHHWWGEWHKDGKRTAFVPTNPAVEKTISLALAVDAIDPWTVMSPAPFGAVGEVLQKGVRDGLLVAKSLRFDFHEKSAAISLPMPATRIGDLDYEQMLHVRVSWSGSERNLYLTPTIISWGLPEQPEVPEIISTKAEHIAIARSVCAPLFQMAGSLEMAESLDFWLTLFWGTNEREPRLQSLAPLARSVSTSCSEMAVPKDALAEVASKAGASTEYKKYGWLDLAVTHDVSIEMQSHLEGPVEQAGEEGCEIDVSSKLSILVSSAGDAVDVSQGHHDDGLHAAASREADRLSELGGKWRLVISKECSTSLLVNEPTEEAVSKALEDEGVTVP